MLHKFYRFGVHFFYLWNDTSFWNISLFCVIFRKFSFRIWNPVGRRKYFFPKRNIIINLNLWVNEREKPKWVSIIFFCKRRFPFFQLWKLMFLFPGTNTCRLIWLMVWVTNYDSSSLLFIQRISKFGNEIYMSFVALRTERNHNMKRDFIFLICFRILSAFCRVFIFLNPA